ncbi:MAG: hypothetical protein ABI435_01300 [Pseudolysinimonas sp.]
MKKRWIVGGVAVALLGVSVVSLVVHSEFLLGRWASAQAASDLRAHLIDLVGVASADVEYQPLALPDSALLVTLTFDAEAESSQWGAASALVHATAGEPAFATAMIKADFREADAQSTALVDPMLFDPQTITSEIDAWRALRDAVGDKISLHLGKATDGVSSPRREYIVDDAQALRAIAAAWSQAPAVAASIPTTWIAPGTQFNGMPTATEMAVLGAVADIAQLSDARDSGQTGTVAAVISDPNGVKVVILEIANNDVPADVEPGPGVAAIARAAFDSGAALVEWMSAAHDASLAVNDVCGTATTSGGTKIETRLTASADDEWFANELAAVGFVLPEGVQPGVCRVAA